MPTAGLSTSLSQKEKNPPLQLMLGMTVFYSVKCRKIGLDIQLRRSSNSFRTQTVNNKLEYVVQMSLGIPDVRFFCLFNKKRFGIPGSLKRCPSCNNWDFAPKEIRFFLIYIPNKTKISFKRTLNLTYNFSCIELQTFLFCHV